MVFLPEPEIRFGLRGRLRAHALQLIRTYQDRPGEPRPFVGREGDMERLGQWLLWAQQRFFLLSGTAGRGKTSLLLHWLDELVQRDDAPNLIYLPVSIRFNTADEAAGAELPFSNLVRCISRAQGGSPRAPPDRALPPRHHESMETHGTSHAELFSAGGGQAG